MNKIENIISNENNHSIKNQVILYKNETFSFFDAGLTRYVFVNQQKTKVIKLLIKNNCHNYNIDEFEVYQNSSEEIKNEMAKTELTYDGAIIEQEFCNPIKMDKRKMSISQMLFASSCRQEVGWTSDGRLVCFDLDEYKKY